MRMASNCAWRRLPMAANWIWQAYQALLADGRVGLVAITHMSNVLGTYTPAARIAAAGA